MEEGLRHVLEKRNRSEGFSLRSVTFRGNGVRPEVREGSWERIRDLIYESRGSVNAVDTNLLVRAHRQRMPVTDRDFSRFPGLRTRNPLPDA